MPRHEVRWREAGQPGTRDGIRDGTHPISATKRAAAIAWNPDQDPQRRPQNDPEKKPEFNKGYGKPTPEDVAKKLGQTAIKGSQKR